MFYFSRRTISHFFADRLQLLLVDTLWQLSHLLGGLKINLTNWLYFSFAVVFSQQTAEMLPRYLQQPTRHSWATLPSLGRSCKILQIIQSRASLYYKHVLPRPQTSVAKQQPSLPLKTPGNHSSPQRSLNSIYTASSASSSFVKSDTSSSEFEIASIRDR